MTTSHTFRGECNLTHSKRSASRQADGGRVPHAALRGLCREPLPPVWTRGCLSLTADSEVCYCGCRAPGPTGFTKIKSYHLLRVLLPRNRLLRGSGEYWSRWGVLDLHKVPFAWLGSLGGMNHG